jgi:hypothetical protein
MQKKKDGSGGNYDNQMEDDMIRKLAQNKQQMRAASSHENWTFLALQSVTINLNQHRPKDIETESFTTKQP